DRTTPTVNPATPLELDGNVVTESATTHDWDQVFADAGSPATRGTFTSGAISGAVAGSFVTDAVNSNADDIFTGGGSKDTQGIQEGPWKFTASKPQGKNDITHAYAALYNTADGHSILYAALDRFDNSGDATVGFWFFRNNVTESSAVSGNGTGPFVGQHSDGDILLVSDFTTGGSVSTIKVFRWTGDDATGRLVPLADIPNTTFAQVTSG